MYKKKSIYNYISFDVFNYIFWISLKFSICMVLSPTQMVSLSIIFLYSDDGWTVCQKELFRFRMKRENQSKTEVHICLFLFKKNVLYPGLSRKILMFIYKGGSKVCRKTATLPCFKRELNSTTISHLEFTIQ